MVYHTPRKCGEKDFEASYTSIIIILTYFQRTSANRTIPMQDGLHFLYDIIFAHILDFSFKINYMDTKQNICSHPHNPYAEKIHVFLFKHYRHYRSYTLYSSIKECGLEMRISKTEAQIFKIGERFIRLPM